MCLTPSILSKKKNIIQYLIKFTHKIIYRQKYLHTNIFKKNKKLEGL